MPSFDRRGLLKTATLGALVLPAYGAWRRPAFGAQTLTGVTYLPPSYEALMWGMQGLVDHVRENAGEDVEIEFYDSGTLLSADEQVTGLRSGTIDFMFHTSSYITRSFEILGITGLPGVVDELYKHGDRLAMETPLWQLINDELAKENIFMLTAGGGILEPEYVWGTGEPISSLDDLKGKKVRVVSYEASTALEDYGVASVRIPSSETYLALQRGTVDAIVANISTVLGRSLQEQLDYAYKMPITAYTIALFVLKDRWDQYDEATKSALWEASKWYDENFASTINNEWYPDKYWPRVQEAGVKAVDPPEEAVQRFEEQSQAIWAWWKEQVGEDVGERAINLALGQAS